MTYKLNKSRKGRKPQKYKIRSLYAITPKGCELVRVDTKKKIAIYRRKSK